MQPVRQPLSFPAGLIPCVWSALILLFAALFPLRLGRSQADSPGFFAIGPLCIMLLGPRCGLLSLGAQADPVGSRDMVFLHHPSVPLPFAMGRSFRSQLQALLSGSVFAPRSLYCGSLNLAVWLRVQAATLILSFVDMS